MSNHWVKLREYPLYEINRDGEIRSIKSGHHMSEIYDGNVLRVMLRDRFDSYRSVRVDKLINETFLEESFTEPDTYIRVVETGEIFENIYECSSKMDTPVSSIKRCIQHPYLKTTRGYHFEIIML